jgi:hypothetical protein
LEYKNYAPSDRPTLAEQEDALCKGLGRALIWAKACLLDADLLLQACLNDRRFDRQIDEVRANWLWRIIKASGNAKAFREPLLASLSEIDEDQAYQRCGLAYHYAAAGDVTFREQLYELFAQQPLPDCECLAEEELIRLDGADAFLVIVKKRGQELSSRTWDWHDACPCDELEKQILLEQVRNLLETSPDEDIQRYFQAWEQSRVRCQNNELSYREQVKLLRPEDIISAAESTEPKYIGFRTWGRTAAVEDLNYVFQRFLQTENLAALAQYLMVFSDRAYPRLEPKVFQLCESLDDKVRIRAFGALSQCQAPAVRKYAESFLQSGIERGGMAELFERNFLPGDEQRLLEALNLPDSEDELHWLLMSLADVLEENAIADATDLGIICYALQPCATCRGRIAKLLIERQAAPAWLINDYQDDCEYEPATS